MQEFIDILCGWSLYLPAAQGAAAWLGAAVAGGTIGNRADWLTCQALGPAWKKLQNLKATEPELNHDLQRAAREAYLRATRELLEQADASRKLRKQVQRELDGIEKWVPATELGDLDALLLDEKTEAAERVSAFHQKLDAWLNADLDRWEPDSSKLPSIAEKLKQGWTVEGPDKKPVRREWHGVISLYFIEQLKKKQPLANVFQAQMLARLHAKEPQIPKDFEKFVSKLDKLLEIAERIETKVGELPKEVAEELKHQNLIRPPRQAILDDRPLAFTGRARELAKLRAALVAGARILLHGHPGSGKSTLALWHGWQERERGSVVFLACGRRPLEQAAADLARKLGIDGQLPPEQQREAAMAWLTEHEALLILDDVWEDPEVLLPPAPARVLLTSRRRDVADLPPQCVWPVGGFSPSEAEIFWRAALAAPWIPDHLRALLEFAEAADYLPYALSVAGRWLARSSRDPAAAIASLRVKTLKAGKLDVSKLLAEAVGTQSPPVQELLRAFGVCAAEGAWLPFAGEIAELDPDAADAAADEAVNASLLRVVDQTERRFAVHPLLHEWLEGQQDGERRARHAGILARRYERWEADWQDCLRLITEVDAALAHLRERNESDEFDRLSFRAFELGRRTGALEAALGFQKSAQAWFEERGDQAGLQASLGNEAVILQAWGKLDEAMGLHKEVGRTCRALGDQAGLSASLGNEAVILQAWGKLDEAMALLKEQERICRALRDQAGLSRSLGNQALILKAWGKLDEAMALLKEQERICRALGDQSGLHASLGNQALILQAWGKLDEAMALHKEEESVCRALGDQTGLSASLGNQAVILQAWGELDEAMGLHKEQERICRALGDQAGLQASLGNRAGILLAWGKLDEAMGLLKEQERICRTLGNQTGLAMSLGNQAFALKACGKLDDAMGLLQETERICRALGDQAGLSASLGSQALILRDWGKPDEAMGLLKEQERICRALGDQAGLARSLGNQGNVLCKQGRIPEARAAAAEALRIFTELRMPRERDQAQANLAALDNLP